MHKLWLTFGSIEKELVGYADVDGSMSEVVDGRSVSWSMRRQEIVSLLMTKSEYVAVTHATKEALITHWSNLQHF